MIGLSLHDCTKYYFKFLGLICEQVNKGVTDFTVEQVYESTKTGPVDLIIVHWKDKDLKHMYTTFATNEAHESGQVKIVPTI